MSNHAAHDDSTSAPQTPAPGHSRRPYVQPQKKSILLSELTEGKSPRGFEANTRSGPS